MNPASSLSRLSGASGRGKALLNLSLILAALALPVVASAGNLTGRYATINLDGSMSDWLPSDVMYSSSEIAAGAPLASTFTSVSVANDSSYVYVAFQNPAPTTINDPWTYNLYLDTDMTSTTGFNGGWMTGGYDHLAEYGAAGTTYSVYSFTGAAQSDWGWNWLGLIGYSYSDTVTEWAIPISSLGLTGDQMRMEFNVTGTGTTAETWANQFESGVGTYTLASVPEPGTVSLLVLGIGALFMGVKSSRRRQHSNG
jgi:PEP-CTERM motif